MESCYINTAHPDFLSGHQAIAIVNEQLQAKNQPAQITDKQHTNTNNNNARQQQLSALQTNNNSSASSYDSNNDTNGSFFGSFFTGPKKTKKTVGGLMEAPPATLKAMGALSEREFMETEVISKV